MTQIKVQLETRVRRSFRVEQVAGMFDVAIGERVKHELTAEVPGVDEAWTIGAIVGPSGSGKTTLARAAFGGAVYKARAWPRERAIIDVLGGASGGASEWERGRGNGRQDACLTVKEITRVLTAVGLGSPPTWLKPYRVLSGGERFRADLCRALMEGGLTQRHRYSGWNTSGAGEERGGFGVQGLECEVEGEKGEKSKKGVKGVKSGSCGLVVMDEFTSSLDRTVAKTTSAAVAKFLRSQESGAGSQESGAAGQAPLRFVAVTCHRDILPWLAPDWILELGGRGVATRLIRERPRRPSFRFVVDRVQQSMWSRFAEQHYLSGGLAASATCYAALWNGEPLAFCAVVATLGWKKTKHITRLVTLPEFQGMGVGGKLLDVVAGEEWRRGFRVTITASHPAIIAHCSQSAKWSYTGVKKTGSTRQRYAGREIRSSMGRAVAGFEYRGQ